MKLLIVTALLILFKSSMTHACSCVLSFPGIITNSHTVFLATVIPTSNGEWDLEIQHVFKGKASKQGKLRDRMAGTNCAIGEFITPLAVNVRYIISARKSEKANIFYTEACGGIKEWDDKPLPNLGKGRSPQR